MINAALLAFGWLLPGGAYLLKGRYAQFALAFVLVCACLTAGIALQGSSLWPTQSELQGVDGFTATVARLGALTKILGGAPYLVVRLFGYSQSFTNGQVHEYGTTLLNAAGLINLVTLADTK
jgi:hypothetical protein